MNAYDKYRVAAQRYFQDHHRGQCRETILRMIEAQLTRVESLSLEVPPRFDEIHGCDWNTLCEIGAEMMRYDSARQTLYSACEGRILESVSRFIDFENTGVYTHYNEIIKASPNTWNALNHPKIHEERQWSRQEVYTAYQGDEGYAYMMSFLR